MRAILRTTSPENERTYRVKSSDFTRMSAVPVISPEILFSRLPIPRQHRRPLPPSSMASLLSEILLVEPALLSNFVERISWNFWSTSAIMLIDLVLTQKYQSEEGSIKNYVR